KRVLSEWLLLFAVRIPLNLDFCKQQADWWNENPGNSLRVLDEDIDRVIAAVKNNNPEQAQEAIRQLGDEGFKWTLYSVLKHRILAGARNLASGKRVFH